SIWKGLVTTRSARPLYPLGGGNGAFGAPLNRSRGSEHSAHSAAAAGMLPAIQVPRSARARRGSALFRAGAFAAERPHFLWPSYARNPLNCGNKTKITLLSCD